MYCRRYTKFYGTSEKAAANLAHDALTSMHADFTKIYIHQACFTCIIKFVVYLHCLYGAVHLNFISLDP